MSVKKPIIMDSKKILNTINSSIHTEIHILNEQVKSIGAKVNSEWRLASYKPTSIIIEDVSNSKFYQAAYSKSKNNMVSISDITEIVVTEGKKSSLFGKSCKQLVEAIDTEDNNAIKSAFHKLSAHGFTGRSIPKSGNVKTKDGFVRSITVSEDQVIDKSVKKRLVEAFVEHMSDNVIVENNKVLGATFTNKNIKLPISEWTSRKSIAKKLKTVAESAYKSDSFNKVVYKVAKLVSEDKLRDAVNVASKFLVEYQEFTMLTRDQFQDLIEKSLASKCCFNDKLCENVSKVFVRTNLNVNKNDFITEWAKVAKKCSNHTLLENVDNLRHASNFEFVHDKFLKSILTEDASTRQLQAEAYKTALKALKDSSKIKESEELSGKLSDLIERLNQSDVDHAVISEVEDLLAEVRNELVAMESLDDFDSDESETDLDLSDLADDDLGSKQGTTVNFNININKDGVDVGGLDDDLGGDLGGDEDEDIEDLLGGGDDEDEVDDEEDKLKDLLNSGDDDEDEDEQDLEDILGSESFENFENVLNERDEYSGFELDVQNVDKFGIDYTDKPIAIAEDCMKVVESMIDLASRKQLTGEVLIDNAESLAKEGLDASGIRISSDKYDYAVEQVCDAFFDELERRKVPIGENQYKYPWRHVWGRRKSAINRREGYGVTNESRDIVWLEQSEDAAVGQYKNVRFTFDHGGPHADLEPIIVSEDRSTEIPVPNNVLDSAYASVGLSESGDPRVFTQWLDSYLTQIEPFNLSEASVNISTNPDGGLSVNVSNDDDVDITHGPEFGVDDTMVGGLGDDSISDVSFDGDADTMVGGLGDDTISDVSFGGDVEGDVDDVEGDDVDIDDEESDDGDMDNVNDTFEFGDSDSDDDDSDDEDDDDDDDDDDDSDDEDEEEEDETVKEDNDITDPSKKKFVTANDKPGKATKAQNPSGGVKGISARLKSKRKGKKK